MLSDHSTYLVAAFGNEAKLPRHCSAHGLRKAGAAIAAENGATERAHRDLRPVVAQASSALYTRRRPKRLAGSAMHLLAPTHRIGKSPTFHAVR